jgi:uncharacterized protein (TIGR02145 family)
MKKLTILVFVVLALLEVQAQDYLINFAGSGASTVVDSVYVDNLTQNTSLKIGGTDQLHLTTIISGINNVGIGTNNEVCILPNPMKGDCSVTFETNKEGEASVELYDLSGKGIMKVIDFLPMGNHKYNLSGIKSGMYLLKISSNNDSYSAKLACSHSAASIAEIKYIGTIPKQSQAGYNMNLKSALSIKDMLYTTGDRLLFTAKSGTYQTITSLVPMASQTVTSYFVPCIDADDNSYPAVQIGNQIWMHENLRVTKYKTGDIAIPLVADQDAWKNLTTDAYCYYNNNKSSFGTTYGALYNWNAVSTGNLCPVGWRVATDADWNGLITYLGGLNVAGGKLKEAGTLHWILTTATVDNRTGFSALPGGIRDINGFSMVTVRAVFWSSTPNNSLTAWVREFFCNTNTISQIAYDKKAGYSVRCIKE